MTGAVLVFRDITDRKKAEDGLADRVRLMAMSAEIGEALTEVTTLEQALAPARALVEFIDGALARIWTLDAGAEVLELQASAGLYTHTDGPHGACPLASSILA